MAKKRPISCSTEDHEYLIHEQKMIEGRIILQLIKNIGFYLKEKRKKKAKFKNIYIYSFCDCCSSLSMKWNWNSELLFEGLEKGIEK